MADLEISGLGKSFGEFEALKDITLSIPSGEFVCLLGGSGCGKTTLLRLVAGLETHNKGDILLDGADLTVIPCHQRNIGMVFQSLALFPHLNVADNIAYGLRLRKVAADTIKTEVERLLSMIGLDGLGDRQVSALSGGQRQRVAIARALALSPEIFLMDEPFSALDAALRDQMQIEIKRIQRALGITTIFVTHDQREAMALADRIVIMKDGKIEQAGPPDQLYAQPVSRYVAEFIGTNNVFDVDCSEDGIRFDGSELGAGVAEMASLSGRHAVAIRPEAITLSTTHTPNSLKGIITTQRRLGAVLEREIQVGDKTIFQSTFAGQSAPLDDGTEVFVSWDWTSAWVIPE